MFEEKEILSNLSRSLRHGVVSQAYGTVIQAVNLFRENRDNTRFVEAVVTYARPVLALTGEILTVMGRSCHDMFLVRKGKINGFSDLDHHLSTSDIIQIDKTGSKQGATDEELYPFQWAVASVGAFVVCRGAWPSDPGCAQRREGAPLAQLHV